MRNPKPLFPALVAVGWLMLPAQALEGYYKDLFVDAGAGLTSSHILPAADTLGLSWERVSTSSRSLTLRIMAGEAVDSNGHLLYPDGSPRFRMLYAHGGKAVWHGESLGVVGRQRIIDFYRRGGSYSGSCAGAILTTQATGTYEREEFNAAYLHIYPGRTHYTQLADSETDMLIPAGSPLLKYHAFGGDGRVASVRHNGGNYVIKGHDYYWAPGTEVLATYAEPIVGDARYQDFLGHGSIWAYKAGSASGRLVLLGSHPEAVRTGEKMHLFAACLRYALDGAGTPQVKARLDNGRIRVMDANGIPGFEKIGDRQYHHFTVSVPAHAPMLALSLEGEAGYEMGLYASRGNFAFAGTATHRSTSQGASHRLTVANPGEGVWYVGVELKSTVTTRLESWGQDYADNLAVLNGISYRIEATHQPVLSAVHPGAGAAAGAHEVALHSATGRYLGRGKLPGPAPRVRRALRL